MLNGNIRVMKKICLISQTWSNKTFGLFTFFSLAVPFLNITNSLQLSHLNFFLFVSHDNKGKCKKGKNLSNMTFFCWRKKEMISHMLIYREMYIATKFFFPLYCKNISYCEWNMWQNYSLHIFMWLTERFSFSDKMP